MISAIILAAGLSTRMEDHSKLLLPFNGKTIIVTVVENVLGAGIKEVIVVTGHNAEKIRSLLGEMPLTIIHNADFNKGLTSSIQIGISVAGGDGYMICLGDMPFITAEEYRTLAIFFENQRTINEACICVAQHKNKRGNPIIFSSFYKNEITRHANPEGCKEIITLNSQNVYPVKINSDSIFKDIDTPGDYRQAVKNV